MQSVYVLCQQLSSTIKHLTAIICMHTTHEAEIKNNRKKFIMWHRALVFKTTPYLCYVFFSVGPKSLTRIMNIGPDMIMSEMERAHFKRRFFCSQKVHYSSGMCCAVRRSKTTQTRSHDLEGRMVRFKILEGKVRCRLFGSKTQITRCHVCWFENLETR